jgi:hypothetical protein
MEHSFPTSVEPCLVYSHLSNWSSKEVDCKI